MGPMMPARMMRADMYSAAQRNVKKEMTTRMEVTGECQLQDTRGGLSMEAKTYCWAHGIEGSSPTRLLLLQTLPSLFGCAAEPCDTLGGFDGVDCFRAVSVCFDGNCRGM